MKYWTLLILCLLATGLTSAQPLPLNKETGKIEYSGIVPLGGNRQELFKRGKAVVAATFRSAKEVIEAEGSEEGYILLRGLALLDISGPDSVVSEVPMHFRLHLKFRNNEYAYTISDITLQSPADSLNERTPLEETLISREEFRKLTAEQLAEAGIQADDQLIDSTLNQAMRLNNQYKLKAHSAINGTIALLKERMAKIIP